MAIIQLEEEKIQEALVKLLDDEFGINADSYAELRILFEDSEIIMKILNLAKSTEDRVYLPTNWNELI